MSHELQRHTIVLRQLASVSGILNYVGKQDLLKAADFIENQEKLIELLFKKCQRQLEMRVAADQRAARLAKDARR